MEPFDLSQRRYNQAIQFFRHICAFFLERGLVLDASVFLELAGFFDHGGNLRVDRVQISLEIGNRQIAFREGIQGIGYVRCQNAEAIRQML